MATLLGIALAVGLLHAYGARHLVELVGRAGWLGFVLLAAFHGIQVLCSALGWRALAPPAASFEPIRTFVVLRWIREGVNNLLPLAQIGGEVVAVRGLWQRGMPLPAAAAATLADLAVELLTQILFTLLGLALLLRIGQDRGLVSTMMVGVMVGVMVGLIVAALVLTILFAGLRFGLVGVIERGLLRLGRLIDWRGAVRLQGVNQALIHCLRQPARVLRSSLWHLLSWLLGTLEVCLILHLLGHDVGLGAGLVIESLGQAVKAAGFAVPGALGIQEGGYVLVCAGLGVPAELALALSLVKRLREAMLGIPALAVWQHFEAKMRALSSLAVSESAP